MKRFPETVPQVDSRPERRGYALLDVVLAVALFSITVTGLIGVMQRINETSSDFARDRAVQHKLASLLAETRKLPLRSMTAETFDSAFGLTYRTYVEPYELDNGDGETLADLYLLTAEAEYLTDAGPQIERAVLIVHHPDS